MATPAIQTLITDAQQVLNLNSLSEVRATMAAALANANVGTPLNPNLTTQQLWDEFYLIVRQPESDIESIITNQLMKFLYAPPAPGGVGADGQVIFNDGGVLAGDPQFLWNKTTNLLTVTGSATITGDLTVRTNALTVDANNNVGIGTTAPTVYANYRTLAIVGGSTGGVLDINPSGGVTAGGMQIASTATGTTISSTGPSAGTAAPFIINTGTYGATSERYRIAGDGVATWSNVGGTSGTAMTLNSTGLGVGGSPTSKLAIFAGADGDVALFRGASARQVQLGTSATAGYLNTDNGTAGLEIRTQGVARAYVDNAGNVGIGVSTFGTSAVKVLGLANATAPSTSPAGMGQLYVESGALKYRGSSGTITTLGAA
jgi:hypothetical protein